MQATGSFLASALVLSCALVAAEDARVPLQPREDEAVILFLLDNSASLPPLDPGMQRRDAIEKIYSFLHGQPYRLILFGGESEVHVDKPQFYRNSGQWTDFFFAVEAAKKLTAEYPEGTDFKMVLITDGKIDPSPREWQDRDVPPNADLKTVVGARTVAMLEEMDLPLYVILIGEAVDLTLIEKMVVAANGPIATSNYAQGIAEFFDDDGVLLQRFIFRLEDEEGLEEIEPIVSRIATPVDPTLELSIVGSLTLMIAVLISVGVRSFPGAGDREILELRAGEPVQVAVDRLRRLSSEVPAWSWKGLSLVDSSRNSDATLTLNRESQQLPPTGFSLNGLDAKARSLIELSLPELRKRLGELSNDGTKDEKIYALNLQYVARDMDEATVERLILSSSSERQKLDPVDFLRAKVHLLENARLSEKLTGPSVSSATYGAKGQKQDLRPGSTIQLGRYQFRVDELAKGGRRDFRLGLSYEKVPSPLFLKRLVPGVVQRTLRLRRSHQRIVR